LHNARDRHLLDQTMTFIPSFLVTARLQQQRLPLHFGMLTMLKIQINGLRHWAGQA